MSFHAMSFASVMNQNMEPSLTRREKVKSGSERTYLFKEDVDNRWSITSYIINSSKGWKDDHELGVAVFPLPANSRSSSRILRWFSIHSTTTEAITSPKEAATTSGQGSTRQTSPTGQQHNRTGTNKTVMIVVLISVLGLATTITFVVVYKIQKMRKNGGPFQTIRYSSKELEEVFQDEKIQYMSYYADNERIVTTVIKIAECLKEKNINVVLDKFEVITNGKRMWSEWQLSSAKNVIMIVTPGYLKICKFDEKNQTEKTSFSFKDQLSYNEICHIRDELTKKPLDSNRFIAILVNTKRDELPFWMKKLNTYEYSNGKLEMDILKVLTDGK